MVAEIRELLWWVRLCVGGRHHRFSPSVSSGYGDNGAGVLQLESRIRLLQGALQVDERWSSCFIRGHKRRFRQVRIFTIFIDRAPPRGWECMDAFALSSQQSSPLVVTLYSWVSTRRSYDGCAKSLDLHAIKHHSTITKTDNVAQFAALQVHPDRCTQLPLW